ncbi:LOW QUALITY PROTEIN: uncharacterized protein LOC135224101 [Macrobrachium nipponense]|uniref:LOW QUALITY PROTEIN: uncharacterized protein LOC135224101 n=1 Tax=Macrobrachium nipponense TaxID=159736 RepID=UPI0030C804E3
MGMEQQYQEQRRGSSSMCLVCGRQGGNTIVVTSVHSFVSASGTPLSDFLVKVVGEDPCYSVSEVICQQCFVLLDRLDAYQARAAEIHSHLTSRYRDTKLELLGQRKRMSELIASSLSNVQELRHGTTLNVSDELTITVVHEALPKKGRKHLWTRKMGLSLGHLKVKTRKSIHCSERPPHLVNEVKDNSDDDDYASDGDDDSVSDADEEKGDDVDNAEEEEEEMMRRGRCEHLSDADDDDGDAQSQRPESSLSQKSKDTTTESQPVNVKHEVEVKEEPAEEQMGVKEDNISQLQLPAGVAVPPQVAEAMLMQSPLATSLLQSFLATSLWFGSPETTNKKVGSQSKLKQEQQVPDDVTREMLAFAAGSTKDKKKRQELKNTGQSYINTKGKLVNAKRVWPQDCSRCPLKCNARISEEDRQKIFAEYWGLADYNLQREYLAAHMQREEKLGPSGLLRTVILYFLTQGKDKKLQVCRQFFLKTLDVSEKASRIVLEKMVRGELGSDSGATSPLGIIRPLSAQGETQESAKENETSNMSNDDCEVKSEGSS